MVKVERSALVSYSASQMFELVNDIEAYPQFMPGCVGAEVLERGEGWLTARLDLSKAGVKQSFVTRNTLTPPTEMKMALEQGPFSHFAGVWLFTPLSESACKVTFTLDFEFKSKLLGLAASKVLQVVASEQVDCLCRRADTVFAN